MKPIYILGLGASGLSVVRHCQRLNLPCEIFDTRQIPPGLAELEQQHADIPIHLGPLNAETLLSAAKIIISPGLNPENPALTRARAAGIPIIGDIEWFATLATAPIIGITGTNAKGTVTTLLALMLQTAGKKVLVGGNIGTPALDLLLEPVPDYYVLELSSFQLETTVSLRALASVMLNISDDHLDRHGTMENYLAAKQIIHQGATFCIVNRDEPATWPNKIVPGYSFGRSEPLTAQECGLRLIDGELYLACGEQNLLATKQMHIKGRHNALNALAALALGFSLGLAKSAMIEALITFPGLEHRCQFIGEYQHVSWYNDSKGTNVGATLAALIGLGTTKNLILIAGGVGKGQDFSPLIKAIQAYCRTVIVLGEAASQLAALFKDVAETISVDSLAEAVVLAKQLATAKESVLLSPACASLDMFKNFEDRGEQFVKLVHSLV